MGRIKKERTGEMHHTNLCQTVRKEQFGGVATIAEKQDDLNKNLKAILGSRDYGYYAF